MNFSINKKLRKLLCLICVLVLTAALFTGCQKKETVPPADTTEPELNLNLNLGTEPEPTETEPAPTETEAVISEKSATVISQLNIRSTPTTVNDERTIIGTLYAGDKVIVERREEVVGIWWAYISSPQSGWICMDFVEMDIPDAGNNNTSTPAATAPANGDDDDSDSSGETNTTSTKGVITANGGLKIRNKAGTDGAVIGVYDKGDVVTILETKNGWGRTNRGWIKLQYVNTTGNATGNTNTNTNTNGNNNSNVTGNGSTSVILKGVVKVNELNIRSSASTSGDRVGIYNYGHRVEILEKNGNWGRTSKGWISLDYVYQDCTTGTNTATGKVTGTGLRIRSGPGTNYDVLGSYNEGDTINILEQFTYGNTTWGCTNKGWISMAYVSVDGSNNTNNNNNNNTNSNTNTGTNTIYGVVTGDGVRIRSGAGTNYDVIGSLNTGDKVTIIGQKTVGDTIWGQTSMGWISMTYVQVD